MRSVIRVCCTVFSLAGAAFGRPLLVTGEVVDYKARPVAGAEVAVVKNGLDWDTQLQEARVSGPVVRTDDLGHFKVRVDIENLRNVFVVARKQGLAWLILADKDHVVEAEGLSISELEAKVHEIGR